MREAMNRDERHQHILHTAKKLFEGRGYDHVTIADVIAASNVARGTFYLHFSSLEDLLTELFEQFVEETWRRIAPILADLSTSVQVCTVEVMRAVFRMFDDDPSMISVFYSGGGQEFVHRKQAALYDKLGGLLEEAIQKRHEEQIPRLEWTVPMLISLVADMSYYAATKVHELERHAFEEHLIQFAMAGLERHLQGEQV